MEVEECMPRVIQTIQNYQEDIVNRVSYMQRAFSEASMKHKNVFLKAGLGKYIENILNCVETNQGVLNEILQSCDIELEPNTSMTQTLKMDHEKLNDCFIQIAREWSSEGAKEREECFAPIIEELRNFDEYEEKVVLVPGCGLARLPFDIASLGFQVVGNEVDPFMLLAGNFILNNCDQVNGHKIFPWIFDLSNRISSDWVTSPVTFPDIDPSCRPEGFSLQMLSGNFLKEVEANLEEKSVDAVVTAFFLDSAPNVVSYVDVISKLIKPDGIWINFGGLNFSFEMLPFSLADLKKVIQSADFEFIKDEIVPSSYGQCDKTSMASSTLQCSFFTCKKKLPKKSK